MPCVARTFLISLRKRDKADCLPQMYSIALAVNDLNHKQDDLFAVYLPNQAKHAMEETLKNIMYQGIGAFSLARQKMEKALAELVDKGQMTRDEGKKIYDEFSEEALKAGKDFKENMKESFRDLLEKSGIPSREEFEALKARVEALERQKTEA